MFVALSIVFAMVICCVPARAENITLVPSAGLDQMLQEGELFTATAVKNELMAYAGLNESSAMLQDILKPGSMEIALPKIDASKIIRVSSPKISELAGREEFYAELEKHGIPREKVPDITVDQYNAIEATWLLDDSFVDTILRTHADLTAEDLSDWTIGEYQAYMKADNLERLEERFTAEQLEELNDRGILIEDTMYLLKEFHQPEFILKQSDATLKATIEDYYAFNLEQTLGAGTVAQWEIASASNNMIMSTPTYNLIPDAVGKYTWVDFPLYGADYFHNSVLTTAYWREIQAYRTLLTQCTIYAQFYERTKPLYCTNLYGTYSISRQGAHEGIDFAIGQKRAIYSPVIGENLNASRVDQLSIYDADHKDGSKTYSILHMSEKTAASTYDVGDKIGMQGNVNVEDGGYHVHFEVHSGRTTVLSSGGDQVVGSISPYRLTEYIGEG